MNDYLLATLLGVIEGLTEFLPISSTAHLRIAQALLGLSLDDEYWKMFAVVIQLGAIGAVLVYFRARLTGFARTFPWTAPARWLAHPLGLTGLAFVVTAVPAFLMTKLIGKNLESLPLIATSLLVGGVAMWVIDGWLSRSRTHRLEDLTPRQAIWIGAAQILSAVFPGTSRSMSTIAGGQLAGLSRETALEFSFFVSIPTMVAATGYELLKTLLKGHVVMDAEAWLTLGLGLGVSFLVALGVIAWFMGWVKRGGFAPFAIYRIFLGLAVLIWAVTNSTAPSVH